MREGMYDNVGDDVVSDGGSTMVMGSVVSAANSHHHHQQYQQQRQYPHQQARNVGSLSRSPRKLPHPKYESTV